MIIGDRLRVLREQKKFSQGEIEKRTGLLRCYISRVENGHTVPAVETLEKFARAPKKSFATQSGDKRTLGGHSKLVATDQRLTSELGEPKGFSTPSAPTP